MCTSLRHRGRVLSLFAPALLSLASCGGSDADVVLYVALDQEHSQRLVRRFEEQSGLKVQARYDTEASKTVGLVSAILEESERPRCDVFWNNEIAHTVRLAQKGLLAAYDSPNASGIPAASRDTEHRYTGFAARARILIVNTELIPDPADRPTSMWDLLDERWKGRCAVALPLTGTTLTHFTALRETLPPEEFQRFLDGLAANEVVLLQSNGATAKAVEAGDVAFAFTDTDDFHVSLGRGHPVAAVFPDQGEGQLGTMLIPNSVAVIKDGPNPEVARQLVDFILSEDVEGMLAASKSAQIPLRATVPGPKEPQILPIGSFRPMTWDVAATAAALEEASTFFARHFGQ